MVVPRRGWARIWLAWVALSGRGRGTGMGAGEWTTRTSPINSVCRESVSGTGYLWRWRRMGRRRYPRTRAQWRWSIRGGLEPDVRGVWGWDVVAMGASGVALTSANGTVWQTNNTGVNATANEGDLCRTGSLRRWGRAGWW